MKYQKLFISLIVFAMFFTVTQTAHAVSAPTAIVLSSTSLSKNSSKQAVIKANASGSASTQKIRLAVQLQKKNGSSWNTVSNWTQTTTGPTANFSKTHTTLPYGTYRTYVTITEYTNSKTTSTPIMSVSVSF